MEGVEVEWGTAPGCHGLAKTCAHVLVIGVDILEVALVC